MPNTCQGCHETSRPPEHYKGDCGQCHTAEDWTQIVVDHSFFPLEQGHGGLACLQCHDEGDFSTLSDTCSSCHTRPVGHFTGPCSDCHNISDWRDAEFDHEDRLTLKGGHQDADCFDCHVNEDYSGLDAACETCHTDDRPPDHFQGGCAECHNVFDWRDADFDHDDFFPTPHRGVSACNKCHIEEPDYSTFECIECHEHRKAKMDDEHRGVNNYSWNSERCLDCHPKGRE